LCLCASVSAQTIRRVNKTPGLNDPAIYTTVQAAHDASADGDIIYVEPTDIDDGAYGNVTFNRRVTLIGTGYDLRTTPNTSFDKRQVSMNAIVFENGSAGSLVMGMVASYIYIRDINCTVTRCHLYGVNMERAQTLLGGVYSYGNNPTITNCRIGNISGGQATNAIISNNIGDFVVNELTGAVINYNTFYCSDGPRFRNIDGSTITNNIFDARDRVVGYSVMDGASNGTTVSNNLCTNIAGLPTGGGNVNSINPNLVFITGNPWSVNPFIDNNVQLATSSPARTVGPGGTPIGAFAGNNPYVLSGVPNVPVITTFFNTGAGTTATPLNVTISVRSAN
jgi:hypothetical protein